MKRSSRNISSSKKTKKNIQKGGVGPYQKNQAEIVYNDSVPPEKRETKWVSTTTSYIIDTLASGHILRIAALEDGKIFKRELSVYEKGNPEKVKQAKAELLAEVIKHDKEMEEMKVPLPLSRPTTINQTRPVKENNIMERQAKTRKEANEMSPNANTYRSTTHRNGRKIKAHYIHQDLARERHHINHQWRANEERQKREREKEREIEKKKWEKYFGKEESNARHAKWELDRKEEEAEKERKRLAGEEDYDYFQIEREKLEKARQAKAEREKQAKLNKARKAGLTINW